MLKKAEILQFWGHFQKPKSLSNLAKNGIFLALHLLRSSKHLYLQLLLRKKAAEELKREQEEKAKKRRMVIDQRCGQPTGTDGMSEGKSSHSFSLFLCTKTRQSMNE